MGRHVETAGWLALLLAAGVGLIALSSETGGGDMWEAGVGTREARPTAQ